MLSAQFDRSVAILRRRVEDRGAGVARGPHEPVADLSRIPAHLAYARGLPVIEAGRQADGVELVVRLQDCAAARTITAADRLEVRGDALSYAILAVIPGDARRRFVELHCSRREGA